MDAIQTLDLAGAGKQPVVGIVGRSDVGRSDFAAAEFLTALLAVDQTAPAEPDVASPDAPVTEEERDIAAETEVSDFGAWTLPVPIATPSPCIKFSGGEFDRAVNTSHGASADRVVTEPAPSASDPTVHLKWSAPDAGIINVPEAEIMFGADAGEGVFGGSVDKSKLLQSPHPPSDPVVRRVSFEIPVVAEPVVLIKGTVAEKALVFGQGSARGGDGQVNPMLQSQPGGEIGLQGQVDPPPRLVVPVPIADVKWTAAAASVTLNPAGAISTPEAASLDEALIARQPDKIGGATPSLAARLAGVALPDVSDKLVDFGDRQKDPRRPDHRLQGLAADQLIWPQSEARGPLLVAERAASFAGYLPAPLPHGLGHQLAQSVARFPDRPVEVTLSPEELGRVRMTLTTGDGGMTLTLVADRPETLALMRRHIDQLAQDFRDMGFQNLSFSFAHGHDPGRSSEKSLLTTEEDDVAPAAALPEVSQLNTIKYFLKVPAEGLDIRI